MRQSVRPYTLVSFLLQLVFVLALLGIAVAVGQTPSLPPADITFNCAPVAGTPGSAVQLKFNPGPFMTMQAILGAKPNVADTTPPIITSVIYSGGASVLPGNVKILATAAGAPFTITASDNLGIVAARLWIDDVPGPGDGDPSQFLPATFYLRWNSKSVAAGSHSFRLVVWDGGGNTATQSWVMVR